MTSKRGFSDEGKIRPQWKPKTLELEGPGKVQEKGPAGRTCFSEGYSVLMRFTSWGSACDFTCKASSTAET